MPTHMAFWQASDFALGRNRPGGSVAHPQGWIEQALLIGPQLESNGYTRLIIHNPGGQYARGWVPNLFDYGGSTGLGPVPDDTYAVNTVGGWGTDWRIMHIDQWLDAKKFNPTIVGNETQLRTFHNLLTEYYGLNEIYYYVGTPAVIPGNELYDYTLKSVEFFMSLGSKAHLAFDELGAPGYWLFDDAAKVAALLKFLKRVKENGTKVILEPRPGASRTEFIGLVTGTFATNHLDVNVYTSQYTDAAVFGEVMRISSNLGEDLTTTGWPGHITKVIRRFWDRHISTV